MRLAADVQTLLCSFCRKPQSAVQQLVSSPSDTVRAYICDECIAVCALMIREDLSPTAVTVIEPVAPPIVEEEPPSLYELVELHLLEALELWITRETLYDDAAEELAELRAVASRWLTVVEAEQER